MERTLLDVPNSESKEENNQGYIEVRPWIRLWSRILDYIIFGSLIFFLKEIFFDFKFKWFHSFLIYLLAIFMWCPIEATLLSVCGTTPGKWLFNITIRVDEGKKLRFIPAFKRSISVWIFGIGMGIPLVCIFGMVKQYANLLSFKTASWDCKKGFTVNHYYLRGFKTTIAVLIYAGFIISQIIVPQMKAGVELSTKLIKQSGVFESGIFKSGVLESAASFNRMGYSFMNSGEYEKAKEQFLKGLDAFPTIELKDTLLNNLSWACYCLEEYEEALKYSEACLATHEEDGIEYSNYANALFVLGNLSEAEKAYKKSLELDKYNSYAYYGLGQLKYDNYEYEQAIQAFGKYTELKKHDPDGWCYLGMSYLYGNKNMIKSKECLDKAMKISSKNIFVINCMADYYEYAGEHKKAEEIYNKALEENQNDYDLLCDIAEFYQNEEKYDDVIKFADHAINIDAASYKAYRIKAQTFFWQDEKQEAIDVINLMIGNNPLKADVYYVAGELYYNEYEYKLAIETYNKALEINPLYENAIIGKISALYYSKRYTACLKFSLEMDKKIDNYVIPWYIGDVYSRLLDSKKALLYYNKASYQDKNEKDVSLLTSIGWEYYYIEDFAKAVLYTNHALQIDESYYNAKNLKKMIEKKQTSIISQVTDFIEENYMYYKPNTKYDTLKSSLKNSESIADINKLFEAAHKDDDLFSFVLYGDNYKRYLENQTGNTVEYKTISKDIDYIRITNFSRSTANEFLDILDNIKNTMEKYLVIDLRGNGGGDTTSGGDILDFLLPDSVVCNLIYKDGYNSPYYSDNDCIKFKHIFLLTDEQTASCAELLSLGLKTYLDNVSVIGRKTFGKGVGQILFEDKKRGFVIFLVNHYWNVREENISDKGIIPDKQIKGNSLELYMDEVNELIKGMQ